MNTRRTAAGAAWLALILAAGAAGVRAAPGDLDLAFAGFGYGGFRTSPGASADMAVAPDGKIVTAGNAGVQLVVKRYLPDGSPDRSFDGDGVAQFTNLSYAMRATSVAVQPDGKIVVAGWAESETDDFLVARITTTGAIDYGFGVGGYVATDFAGQGDHAEGVAIQPDGKIVAAGTSTVGGDDDFSAARYNANGTPDLTFSGDGRVTIGFGGDDACHDLALQPDGQIVLVGDTHGTLSEQDFAVARLNGDGTLDDSFHYDGKTTVGLDGWDSGVAVALYPDGRIVVAGPRDAEEGAMARLLPNGFLDPTLDGDGRMTVPGHELWGVAVQPDGRIVIVGEDVETSPVYDNRLALHRFEVSGAADPTFDGDGHALYDLGAFDMGLNVALLPDGRILAHGTTGGDFFTQNASLLLRIWPDGSADVGGHQAMGFPDSFLGAGAAERVAGLAVQPDGKVVVAGEIRSADGSEMDFALARFLPDGDLDPTFGANGCVTFSFHNLDVATGVALQPDGKIVVAGHTGTGANVNVLVARFDPDGSLDTSFGFFGYNVLDFLGGPDYAQDVAIAPDGKIVIGGTVYNGARYVFGVCRFTSDGYVDTTFDLDGKQLHEIVANATHWATAVVVQSDLKIVLGGHVGYDFCLARYHESGAVDFGFGPGGLGYSRVDMGGDDYLGAITQAGNGWFYAAGSRTLAGNTDFALAQFYPDGYLASNWYNGRAYVDWGGYDAAYAIDWRSDGQVIAAGFASGAMGWAQFSTATANFPLTATTDLVGYGESTEAVSFTGVSRIVAAATQDFNGDQNFALARFETSLNAVTAVAEPQPAPPTRFAFRLHPAFPNPLVGRTVVAFEMASPQPVRVELYDAAGRRVRTLVAGPLPAGRHETTWDGTDDAGRRVAAGVYFVRAEGATGQASEKILLLR